ncbi:MAG TPA: tail fiber domain-containing protein [Thermoanaerobaculia bacterium]|nr:tail fiber domain-containing protein [Thermoanaerobaculia bacterium]
MSRLIRISPLILASLFYANGVLGQEIPAARQIANWPAPLSWTPSGETMSAPEGVGPGGARGLTPLSTTAVPLTSPEPFVGITPCRIANTTGNGGFSGAYGPPALSQGVPRDFTLTGQCGIPASAVAVSLNLTVTNTTGAGFIKIFPAGGSIPTVSTLNYVAGQVIANAAVVPLGTGGAITVIAGVSGTDFILDANGYYGSTAASNTNVFLGPSAGNSTMSGIRNTAIGHETIPFNTTGNDNTAIGSLALNANTTGVLNTAVGRVALINNTSGSGNTAVGIGAGANLTTGGNNIDIGNAGVAAESNTIRIGTSGTQTKFVVAGVRDATVLGDANAVLIDSNGTLGTTPFSSEKWKREIADIGQESSALLKLRPVSFYYTSDTRGIRQYGLIAEEVAEVMPALVQCSANGEPEAVRYQFLVPMLVNEVQKDRKTIQEQSREIQEIKAELQRLEAVISVRADRETTPRP